MLAPSADDALHYWSARASSLGYDGHPNLPRALDRLVAGDVSETQHGVRVQCRPGFDSRVRAQAYWIRDELKCKCRATNQSGSCSHVLAALIFRNQADPTYGDVALNVSLNIDETARLDEYERIAYARGFRQ